MEKERNKIKKGFMIILVVCLLLTAATSTAFGAAKNVTVTLPNFKVTLNGKTIDNSSRKYPLIVYKDITYFPMTYYDCRFLGVETKYKKETGLQVTKAGVPQAYQGETGSKNGSRYTASTAPFPIKVNGKAIDNNKEAYPLLLFRNVTYFPLTYRFAAEEFDWNYGFDAKTGLSISEKSGTAGQSAAVTEVTLPIVDKGEGAKGAFTIAGDCYYYQGAKGKIYQAPMAEPKKAKMVYQLPTSQNGEAQYVMESLYTKADKAFLDYHVGGGIMGTDYVIQLNADGTSAEIDSGYSHLENFGDYTVRVNQGVPPGGDNLTIKDNSKPVDPKEPGKAFASFGDPDYIYGWAWSEDDNSRGGGTSKALYRRGDEVYVLAYYKPDEAGGAKGKTTGVHTVNIKTGKTARITQNSAQDFQIADDVLYFLTMDHTIYKKSLAFSEGGVVGNQEEKIAEKVGSFAATGSDVFYVKAENLVLGGQLDPAAGVISANTHFENGALYQGGASEPINPGGKVKSLSVQEGYILATFEEESSSPYKLMVLTKDGKVIYKSSEDTNQVMVYKGKLVFVKS